MKINNYLVLTRPVNLIIVVGSILLISALAGINPLESKGIIFASLSAALIAAAGNVINDVFDVEIDLINKRDRVIPSGKVSKNNAVIFYLFLNVTGLLSSFHISREVFVLAFCSVILLFLYSSGLKRVFLLNNLIVAFLTGFTLLFGAVAIGNYKIGIIPAVFAFWTNLIREILKDIEDVTGDIAAEVRSVPIVLGINPALKLVVVLLIIEMVISILPFVLGFYSIEYFIVIMMSVNLLFLYVIKILQAKYDMKLISKSIKVMKITMVLGIAAIYLGNL